jgi:hypothetical protein
METLTAAMANRGVKRLLVLSVAFLFNEVSLLRYLKKPSFAISEDVDLSSQKSNEINLYTPSWAFQPRLGGNMGLRSNTSKLLVPLRSVLGIHLLTVVSLGALAGMFLSGNDTAVALHEIGSRVLLGICLLQIVLTALLRAGGKCPPWVLFSAIGVLVAEMLETYAGYQRILILHVPLAILIFGGIMRQLLWLTGTVRASKAAAL